MAQGSGVAVIASFVQAVNWWTAVNANVALKGIHIENDSVPLGSPELIPDTSLGSPWEKGNDLGNTMVDGSIVFKSRYDSLGTLFAMCMGATSVSPTQLDPTKSVYRHVLTLTPDLAGKFGTYAVYDGVEVRECPSVKVTGFELRGTGGQALDLSFPVMCDDRIVAGQVNTASGTTNLGSVTFLAEDPRMIFDDVKIRINAQGGAALADSDAFYASDFSVVLTRPHEAPFVTNRRSTRSEPIANGKPTIRFTANEASYVNTSRIVGLRARTAYKMDIEAIGAKFIDGSAYPYRFLLEFPGAFWSAVRMPISGPTRIVSDLEMVLEQVAVAPTGMAGLTVPMRMTIDCFVGTAFMT